MIIDRKHKNWVLVTLSLALFAWALYLPYHYTAVNGTSGGSLEGILYALAGTALVLFASLLTLRKRVPTRPMGRSATWMRAHIWLGLLSLPLLLFHSGFHWGGLLTTVLSLVYGIVIVSGLVGLILQQFVPKMMMVQVPAETVYSQIGKVVKRLEIESRVMVEGACGPVGDWVETFSDHRTRSVALRERGKLKGKIFTSRIEEIKKEPVKGGEPLIRFYLDEVRPFLRASQLADKKLGAPDQARKRFAYLKKITPSDMHDAVENLEAICDERRQLAIQVQLHRWLHGWLFVHIPLTVGLLTLIIVHAVFALRY